MTLLQLELKLKNYSDNPNEASYKELIQIIKSLSLSTLNNYCLQNETVKQLLALPAFMPFWQRKMAGITIKGLPDFRFKNTQHLDAFALTLGYFNYYQALRYPEQQTKYIQQALTFHSFQALNYYAEELILQFANNENNFEMIAAAIPFFEKEAAWHGTPAYLLAAMLYFRLGLALKSIDQSAARVAFQLLIKNLELAKLAEAESINELNNAYFAQDFAHNNPFNLPSIKAIRDSYILHAGSCLNQTDINLATQDARLNFPNKVKPSTSTKPPLSEFEQAMLTDSAESIRLLFKTDELEKLNSFGETALLFAIRHGKINSVRCLLSLGEHRLTDKQRSMAMEFATAQEYFGILRLLINQAPEGNQPAASNELQQTLVKALNDNSALAISSILQSGISPELILPSGKTGFAQLISMRNQEGIELFLNFGVSLAQRDSKGETILFTLLEMNGTRREIAEDNIYFRRFIALGADINAQNNLGETLLIKAAKRGDLRTVSFLVAQDGINLHLTDNSGQTALNYAEQQKNNQWIAAVLEQKRTENSASLIAFGGQKQSFFVQRSTPIALSPTEASAAALNR